MLLSVIIPIYNVDKYIRECFDSILSQEFADIEIICIDDGSTDTSGHICDEYAARDTRFIVKHTTNQGVSAARNLGLSLAQGEYIAWIDPDDYIATDWLSSITQAIREYNCDILVFDYIRVKNNQTIIKQYREKSGYVDQLQFLSDITDDQIIENQLWQKVFKRELFHDIRFPLNITCMEDYAILHFLIEKANTVFYLKKPLYYYRQRNDSLVMKLDLAQSSQSCLIAQERYEYLSAKYPNIQLIGYWGQAMGFCMKFHKSDKAEQQRFKKAYSAIQNRINKNIIHILSSKQLLLKNKLKLILIGSGLIGLAVHLQQGKKKIKSKLTDYYWKLRNATINTIAYWVYDRCKIDENIIFLESRDGLDFTGNIFRIVEELSKEKYNHFKLYVYVKGHLKHRLQVLKKAYGLKDMHIITREAIATLAMERAKYIVSDSGIPRRYVKREGQIILNTWHGTPLKLMGKYVKHEEHIIELVQHFFLSSDYLLYPSEYMKEKMLESYMVENVMAGKVLMGGYPRNSVFFDHQRRQELRDRLGYTNLTVYAYMPTHRGNVVKMKNKQQLEQVIEYLTEIDAELTDDQILLVKLHVFNQSKIDFVQFEHIKPFPTEYETYDVLNATDGLITDYSSVFFDYANTRNKIILFTYDEEEYFEDRGTYFSLDELPFPKVKNVQELIREMNTLISYDDQEFLARFCPYDHIDATEKLCDHVFNGKKQLREENVGNGKENVLIMAGSLAKNGITTAIDDLVNGSDTDQKNYYIILKPDEIGQIPSKINRLFLGELECTLLEKIICKIYSCKRQGRIISRVLRQLYTREKNRCFYGVSFEYIVQLEYNKLIASFFSQIKKDR